MADKLFEATKSAQYLETQISESVQVQWMIQFHRIKENIPNDQYRGLAVRYDHHLSKLLTIENLLSGVKITSNKHVWEYIRYLFQQISKFLEDSMDIFNGIRTLKSIDYSKNNWF